MFIINIKNMLYIITICIYIYILTFSFMSNRLSQNRLELNLISHKLHVSVLRSESELFFNVYIIHNILI